MKKNLALLMVLIMIIPAWKTSAFAKQTDMNLMEKEDYILPVYGKDETVQIYYAEDCTDQLFYEVSSVDYVYCFNQTGEKQAAVNLLFSIHDREKDYNGLARGTANAYKLSSGDVFWEGPLEGTIIIGKEAVPINISFSKMNQTEDIQVGLTFRESCKAVLPIALAFGGNVITKQIIEDLNPDEGKTIQKQVLNNEGYMRSIMNDEGYAFKSTSATWFSGNVLAQRMRVYFNDVDNYVMLTIQTNTAGAAQTFASVAQDGVVDTSCIRYMKWRLSVADDAHLNILGICDTGYIPNNNVTDYIIAFFQDLLIAFGYNYPTNLISMVLSGISAHFYHYNTLNNNYVETTYTLSQNANFDTFTTGMPVTFGIDSTLAAPQGYYTVSVNTELKYYIGFWPDGGDSYMLLYHSAPAINSNVSLYLDH